MVFLLYLFAFLTAVLAAYVIIRWFFSDREELRQRLERLEEADDEEEDLLGLSFSQRVIGPAMESLSTRLLKLAPREVSRAIQMQLLYAGHPWGLNLNRLLSIMLIAGLVLPLFIFTLARLSPPAEISILPRLIILGLVGFLFPPVMVRFRAAKRQQEIGRAMPEMLDLLLISVEAGMGFDMAVRRVTERLSGNLSSELKRFLDETSMGRTRAEELRAMVDRTGVEDLWLFANSIIQAEQRWGNIAGALESQANHLRQKRRRRAEEEARKAPVKMLFPIIFLIFPALFVVIMGPAILQIIKLLAEMF